MAQAREANLALYQQARAEGGGPSERQEAQEEADDARGEFRASIRRMSSMSKDRPERRSGSRRRRKSSRSRDSERLEAAIEEHEEPEGGLDGGLVHRTEAAPYSGMVRL